MSTKLIELLIVKVIASVVTLNRTEVVVLSRLIVAALFLAWVAVWIRSHGNMIERL